MNQICRRGVLGACIGALTGCTSGGNPISQGSEGGDTDTLGKKQATPWGVARIGAPAAHARDIRGEGVDVAVLDTGIAPDHPDLPTLYEGTAVGSVGDSWADTSGHGTHVAGVIAAADNDWGVVGVSPGVRLHPVRVFQQPDRGDVENVAAGLRWVADRGYDVANLSLSSRIPSKELAAACKRAADAGVVVVAATAPDDVETVGYPAEYSSTLAVGATDEDDRVAEFSRRKGADVFAPGTGITSTTRDGYAKHTGTSTACPHVTGAAALLRGMGHDRAGTIERLLNGSTDAMPVVNVAEYG